MTSKKSKTDSERASINIERQVIYDKYGGKKPKYTPAQCAADLRKKGKRCHGFDLIFDPNVVGKTVGGLWRKGWDVCPYCGECSLSLQGHTCAAPVWELCKGGFSVDIGTGRIRLETHEALNREAIMARIVRLPELERENEELKAALNHVLKIEGVRAALEELAE